MHFPKLSLTKEEYRKGILNKLSDTKTIIFFDTNLFSQMFKLHELARYEFYTWFSHEEQKDRVKIASWSMQEYNSRAASGNLKGYFDSVDKMGTIQKLLNGTSDFLKMYYNQEINKETYPDKKAFLEDVDLVLKKFNKIKNASKYTTLSIHTLNEEFTKYFQDKVVFSDIYGMLSTIKDEAEFRTLNRIPPGYFDGTKDDNKYGDLIIWKEILNFVKQSGTTRLIFVSNDGKKDIVYYPFVKGPGNQLNELKDVRLPDPRLVGEFKVYSGSEDLSIISFAALIEFLSEVAPDSFRELSVAVQVAIKVKQKEVKESQNENSDPFDFTDKNDLVAEFEDFPKNIATNINSEENDKSQTKVETIDLPRDELPKEVVETTGYDQTALADADYVNEEMKDSTHILSLLKSHDWYAQNDGIAQFRDFNFKSEQDRNLMFVIGRNIYQAADGNAFDVVNFIEELAFELERKSSFVQEHVLNGIFYEIYFNSRNEFRKKYKAGMIDPVFAIQRSSLFQKSISFIRDVLEPHIQQLFVRPNATPELVRIHIKIHFSSENEAAQFFEINDILIDNRSAVMKVPYNEHNSGFDFIFNNDIYEMTLEKMKRRISTRFAIPLGQMGIDFNKVIETSKIKAFTLAKPLNLGIK